MTLFDYPKSASFGRVLPKNKIYQNAKLSTKVKDLFVQQIEKIVWAYKLAPETINLPSTASVPEIQVFNIGLKTGKLTEDVLQCIDKAIPFPLIFELHYQNKKKTVAAFKRPSDAYSSKWVISDYFETAWLDGNVPSTPLPIALDLGGLYEKLLEPLMPYKGRVNESIQTYVARMNQVHFKERELEKLKIKLRNEKQFNRKVAINTELRKVIQEIQQLTHSQVVDEH